MFLVGTKMINLRKPKNSLNQKRMQRGFLTRLKLCMISTFFQTSFDCRYLFRVDCKQILDPTIPGPWPMQTLLLWRKFSLNHKLQFYLILFHYFYFLCWRFRYCKKFRNCGIAHGRNISFPLVFSFSVIGTISVKTIFDMFKILLLWISFFIVLPLYQNSILFKVGTLLNLMSKQR